MSIFQICWWAKWWKKCQSTMQEENTHKKWFKSAHERLLWCLNLDCVSLCLFLSIYGNNIQKEEKLTKGFSALSSPPASALIDAGIKYALTSADHHRQCRLSLRLSWFSWIFAHILKTIGKVFGRFAKNIFGSPGQKIFINSLILSALCTIYLSSICNCFGNLNVPFILCDSYFICSCFGNLMKESSCC